MRKLRPKHNSYQRGGSGGGAKRENAQIPTITDNDNCHKNVPNGSTFSRKPREKPFRILN
jgi:hypothetical protein